MGFIGIIDEHVQKYNYSCIPSAVEMILKLEGLVNSDYYDLQNEWKNRCDGNFSDFDNKELYGLKFQKEFGIDDFEEFPFDSLFERIDDLLSKGRFIAISLQVNGGWHNYIIQAKNNSNDYNAITKIGNDTEMINNVKERVREMKGTDILTYEKI